jgi:hypothetical protein
VHSSKEDGIREGWSVVSAWAEGALPQIARRRILLLAIAVGAAVSIVVAIVLGAFGGLPAATADVFSLCSGVAGASIAAYVAILRETRARRVAPTTAPRRRPFVSVGLKYGSAAKIRDAWLAGEVPDVDVAERLTAAAGARRSREILPRTVVMALALVPLWAAGTVVAVVLATQGGFLFEAFYFPAFGVISLAGSLQTLHGLGRTRAPLETESEVPDHLEADGRKKTKPYKLLGTDHPDDYRR